MNNFAVLILTHGRAKEQLTLKTLKQAGYTGKVYLVIDDEDEQKELYKELYGDMVIEFSKKEVENKFDTMTNKHEYRTVTYARQKSYEIARDLGLQYYLMADDDITNLLYRTEEQGKLKSIKVKNADMMFEKMVDVLKIKNIASVGLSNNTMFMGGAENENYKKGFHNKVFAMYMIDVSKQVNFKGIFNEDLHFVIDCGVRGLLPVAYSKMSFNTFVRGTTEGGLSELYKANSDYTRDFYTVMAYPNIAALKQRKGEIKLTLLNDLLVPKLLNERFKK